MAEKDTYNVEESYSGAHPRYVDPSGVESKEGRIAEAAALYGDIQTAEEYGYVTRGYVERVPKQASLVN